MALDDLKVPREKPSIKDQIPLSIFSYDPPVKYTIAMRGIVIGSNSTLLGRHSIVPLPAEIQENDYVENTYIDDYFQ
jgi:hypothetical protein